MNAIKEFFFRKEIKKESAPNKPERLYYMDILRFLAVTFVMFAHFVSVASWAKEIPEVINQTTPLPLIDGNAWRIWIVEIRLIEIFQAQFGIVGVLIFFLITGYLIAMMLEKYNRFEFLVNRIFRIFPTLAVSILTIGIFLNITQGISFSVSSYLASMTLTTAFFKITPVTGVLWTLFVEVWFYLIACIVGKFSFSRLVAVQTILLAFIYYSNHDKGDYVTLVATNAKYMLFILVGTAIRLTECTKEKFDKITLVGSSFLFAYLGFKIFEISHLDESTYKNLGSQALALIIFLSLYTTQNWTKNTLKKLPLTFYKIIDLGYPLYLLHVAIGFVTIALLRDTINNNYMLLFCAVLASYFCSWIVHVLIEKPSIAYGKKLYSRLRSQ